MDIKMHMMETRSLHQIKKLLHTKGNNYQSENISCKMGYSPQELSISRRLTKK
jgi:hypothetical protein